MPVSLRAQAGPPNRQKVDRAAEQRGRAAYQQFCINCLLQAIDYKTGKIRWSHKWPSPTGGTRSGLLSTAGKLLFAGDNASNLVALDPATGVPLWHAGLHTGLSNGRITYELGGVQYLVAGAGDSLYAFALRRR